jgi:hypothetical protein
MIKDQIISQVCAAYGSAANLSRALGITRQAVALWRKVPLKYVRRISAHTGIPLDQLRPDIYAGI